MRKGKIKSIHKKLIIGGAAAAMLVGGYFYYRSATTKDPIVVPAESTETEENKQPKGIRSVPSQDKPESSDELQKSSEVTVTITSARTSDGKVRVRALVSGLKSGYCTATFEKSGVRSVEQTVPIGIVTSYYACQGFDIPVSQFPSKGTWTVEVMASSGGKFNISSPRSFVVN